MNTEPKRLSWLQVAGIASAIFILFLWGSDILTPSNTTTGAATTAKKPVEDDPFPKIFMQGCAAAGYFWLQENLKDPGSMEIMNASNISRYPVKNLPGWVQTVTIRSKNGFGAYTVETYGFAIYRDIVLIVSDDSGKVIYRRPR